MGTDRSVYQDEYFLALGEKRKIIEELNAEPYIEHWKSLSLNDIDGECWVDVNIIELNGYFKISNFERIKALTRPVKKHYDGVAYLKEKIRKHCSDKQTGYRRVSFKVDNFRITLNIHVLMALHFVDNPNPKKYKQVNHLTGNKWDNRPKNLEWVTRRQDLIHKYHILNYRPIGKKGSSSSASRKVIQKGLNGNFIKEWNSQGEITRELGFNQSDISRACNKLYAVSHGFRWEFKL